MPSEWYSDKNLTEIEETELELIQKGVNQHLIPIIVEATGELEDFDRNGAEATIYNRDGNSTGIKLTHAVYGEPQFQIQHGREIYEQLYRITLGGEVVTILLDQEGDIKEIQKKFKEDSTYTVSQWLNDKYMLLYNIIDNYNTIYHFEIEDFIYHGKEEMLQSREESKSLGRRR